MYKINDMKIMHIDLLNKLKERFNDFKDQTYFQEISKKVCSH